MSNEKKKIKVAFVLGALNRGGMESLILDICRRAEQCPFEVICIYRKEGTLSEEFHKTKVKLLCLPRKKSLITYVCELRNVLLGENVDIVHSQTPSNSMVLGLSLLGTRIKLITSFHGLSFADANYFIRKYVYLISERIICVSESQKRYYQSRWNLPQNNKLLVVYNGIDTSKIIDITYPIPDFLLERDGKEISLVVVGSFRVVRSQEFLLNVINQQKDFLREHHVKVYFVGGSCKGEEQTYLKCEQFILDNQIEDLAVMLGVRKDVFAILQHSDGFFYSSNRDTFGIAVVEAMMSGIPVITNDYIVMKEITKNGSLATIYESNNMDDCAQKLELFVCNIKKNKEDAGCIVQEVKRLYSIENHIQKITDIYDTL